MDRDAILGPIDRVPAMSTGNVENKDGKKITPNQLTAVRREKFAKVEVYYQNTVNLPKVYKVTI